MRSRRTRHAAVQLRPLYVALCAAIGLTASIRGWSAETTPGAGNILQQMPAPQPSAPATAPPLSIERTPTSAMPPSIPFLIKTLQIVGNTRLDSATLHALVAEAEGKSFTLPQLDALIARITDHYRQAGYPLARAIIPAQTISEGVVRIEVIEARYGEVKLDNRSNVSTALLNQTLAPLKSGAVVSQAELDQTLLLLFDIPGIDLNALLRPGEAVGTSDLAVQTMPGAAANGQVYVDNQGSRYTGRVRLAANANRINLLGRGDVLSVNALTSGERLNYGRLAYELQLNGYGSRLAAAWSKLHYRLGDTATSLLAHGDATVASLWLTHPLLRSIMLNVRGRLQFDRLDLTDHIDSSATFTDRRLQTWTLSVAGDARDFWLGGGSTTWNLGATSGNVRFDNLAAELADAATAQTKGRFSRWNLYLSRQQILSGATSLAVTLQAQRAQGNLDASQKMALGGPNGVHAYDTGAASGDSGYILAAELRRNLDNAFSLTSIGQWQAMAFADTGYVRINQNPWAGGVNSVTLSGAGIGLNWYGPDQWNARGLIATPIEHGPEVPGIARSTRAWLEVGRRF